MQTDGDNPVANRELFDPITERDNGTGAFTSHRKALAGETGVHTECHQYVSEVEGGGFSADEDLSWSRLRHFVRPEGKGVDVSLLCRVESVAQCVGNGERRADEVEGVSLLLVSFEPLDLSLAVRARAGRTKGDSVFRIVMCQLVEEVGERGGGGEVDERGSELRHLVRDASSESPEHGLGWSGDGGLSSSCDKEELRRCRPSGSLHFLNGLDEEESGQTPELFALFTCVEGETVLDA